MNPDHVSPSGVAALPADPAPIAPATRSHHRRDGPSLGLDEALADLQALDVINPLLRDLEQIVERVQDTQGALGSDVMRLRNQGLDGLVDDLGARFKARARKYRAACVGGVGWIDYP